MDRMRDVFIEAVTDRMANDEFIFFLTADLGSPKLDTLAARFPDRFVNVGIAEQNLVNVAAGLALEGFTVFAYGIAPFVSMRCYEQTRVNLSLLSRVRPVNVTLLGVGAGFSYDLSGPTHQAMEDISIMRTLPNILVGSPCDCLCARAFVDYCLKTPVPKYIRLDGKPLPTIYPQNGRLSIDEGFSVMKSGGDVCLVSTGYMTHKALAAAGALAAAKIGVGVIDVFLLKGLDEGKLATVLKPYRFILSIEEGFAGKGGLDSMILHLLNRFGIKTRFDGLGIGDHYGFAVGSREELLQDAGLDEAHIVTRVRRLLSET